MGRPSDPFAIKEWGGDISDRDVSGWSWRVFEGTSIGESDVGSLKRVISQRAPLVFLILLGLVILFLTVRIFWLQAVQGNYWRGIAEGNRIRLQVMDASRGLIVDKKGQVIAYNVASFRLLAVPAELPKDEIKREEFLTSILAEVPTELLLQDNITQLTKPSYLPLVIAMPLSHELALKIMTLVGDKGGLRVEPTALRYYNDGKEMAHLLGYVGQVSPEEYQAGKGIYRLIDSKGKVGLEAAYEHELRGEPGVKQVEVDASGLERKIFATKPSISGARLELTIDQELQSLAYASLEKAVIASKGKGGSVVVMEAKSGAVRSLVSYPSFDPNVFTVARNSETITQLLRDQNTPLFNRTIGGEYPSGSTIKPLVAAAALEEKVITPNTSFLSTGGIYAGNQFFADWRAGGHGITNVYKAIAESVNTFFYLVGGGSTEFTGLGITRLSEYLQRFGLGKSTGFDIAGERAGFVPTALWKLEVFKDHWYRGDTYNVSIGQGHLLVTPLQLAVAYAAVATDGSLVKPYVVEAIVHTEGDKKIHANSFENNINMSANTLKVVQQGMRQTVVSGSARSLAFLSVPISGKTGTAQTGVNTPTHAWFAGYAPADNPDIVVVVMIEFGGEGSQVAVPVARDIFQWYDQNR